MTDVLDGGTADFDELESNDVCHVTATETGVVAAAVFALLVSGAMAYIGANPFINAIKNQPDNQPIKFADPTSGKKE